MTGLHVLHATSIHVATILAPGSLSSTMFRILGAAVWIGFGFLTVAMIVLMRSSWAKEKPLTKCVALSILAHSMLMLAAYGTRLVIQEPIPEKKTVVFRLSKIEFEESSPNPSDESEELKPGIVTQSDSKQEDLSLTENTPGPRKTTDQLPEQVTSSKFVPKWKKWQPVTVPKPDSAVATNKPPTDPFVEQNTNERNWADPENTQDPKQPLTSSTVDIYGTMTEAPAPLPQTIEPEAPVAKQVHSDNSKAFADELPPLPLEKVDFSPRMASTVRNRDLKQPDQIQPVPWQALRGEISQLPELVRRGDGRNLPAPYRLRMDSDRRDWFLRMGGSAESLRAIEAALQWLSSNQESDGRWDSSRFSGGREDRVAGHDREGAGTEADSGMTGLALLSFLGAGHTQYEGDYQPTVQRGIRYLIQQQRNDGFLGGNAKLFAAMYCHSMATLALSESLALTGDPQLQTAVTKAIQYSIFTQHDQGGWRYQAGDSGDMSQFGWQVMAFTSARHAGIHIPEAERAKMRIFLNRCSSGDQRALAGYRPGQRPTPTMSAEAMVCRIFLDQTPSPAAINTFESYMSQTPPSGGKPNLYYWYYGTLALHQLQGPQWKPWSRRLQEELVKRQRQDSNSAGSWDPDTVWGSYGGRVYSTAMATLSLEVYFRYLPLYSWLR